MDQALLHAERVILNNHGRPLRNSPPASARRLLAPPRSLMRGQDPSVVWRHGWFYLAQSENGERGITGIFIYRSRTIHGLGRPGECQRRCVWIAPRKGPISRNLWAPELAWVDGLGREASPRGERSGGQGRWYIYFAADDGRNENHRMYALESESADACGPYQLKGKVAAPGADRWAIDGALIDVEEPLGGGRRLYFVWSGWEGLHNGMQRLFVARMSDPWTITGERVEISRPDASWERRSGPHPCYVNEGPAVAVRGGKVVVGFSANGFWSDDYCVGILSCDVERILDPHAWTKSIAPAFCKTDALFGVGHNCFVKAGDGAEAQWWNVFHAVRRPGRGGKGREIFAQRMGWENGLPALGRPGDPVMSMA
ncbi:MAG TPA: glycoside hydrolase family 43 protein [Phycisphaerae bacterium]|nr:glycoside hydrolase family 43 protein [Phycisphaerae bacterium]